MREITKNINLTIEDKEETFRITKMDAFNGAFLMKVVTEKAMPMLQRAIDSMDDKSDESVEMKMVTDLLPGLLETLTQEELKKIMTLCLQTVDISLPAGYQKVVDARGNFGVESLQYDTAACLRLVYEVIVYNCSGFFEGSGLSSVLAAQSGSRRKR